MGGIASGARLAAERAAVVQSGRPFTPRVTSDNSNTGNLGGQFGYDRPDEVPLGTPGAVTYDGRAFQIAPPYTFGYGRPQHPDRPGTRRASTLAISKITRLGGTRRLEARAEIYNLLNRTNLGLPDSFVDHPTFGESLSAGPGRMAQVAVRFRFWTHRGAASPRPLGRCRA